MRYSGRYCVPKLVTGVYILTHVATGQMYIGSSGRCVYNRLKHHFAMLRAGKHATPKLQALWNEDPRFEAFSQELYEQCDIERARVVERDLCAAHVDALLNGAADAARKRWSDPKYRASVSERCSEIAKERNAAGTFGKATWTETSYERYRRSMRERHQNNNLRNE